jgi:hypothetical protein
MGTNDNPRLLARMAGVFYLVITALAMFAYLHVRGQVMVPGDVAQTAANILAHEQLFRMGAAASVIVAMCNLPLGFLLYELCKVVNRRVALLALLFIVAGAILEARNPGNYFNTLYSLNLPELASAFDANQRQALARLPMRLFGAEFGVALSFFGVFCILIGYLLFKSGFFPRVLGVLMVLAGVSYLLETFTGFLALPDIPYLLRVTLVAEVALMLWLLVFGVNEAKWRERAAASAATC